MANLFEETANQEKEHAKMWFKEFHGIGTPEENLTDAAQGEHEEWTDMYKRMSRRRRAEEALYGTGKKKFELVAEIEAAHERRYLKLLQCLKQGETFKGEAPFRLEV